LDIFGIGIDIIEVKRVKGAIEKFPGFLKKVFSAEEIKYCENKKNISAKYISYAQRFAVKEAVLKALATGIGKNVSYGDINVINTESGKPEIRLSGKTKSFCNGISIKEIKISLSGIKDYAAAFAVALME